MGVRMHAAHSRYDFQQVQPNRPRAVAQVGGGYFHIHLVVIALIVISVRSGLGFFFRFDYLFSRYNLEWRHVVLHRYPDTFYNFYD